MSRTYVLFFSTNHAMWAEQVLVARGIAAKVVAVPRHLSSDCGYCLEIPATAAAAAAAILRSSAVEFDRIGG
ncbi:MAG: DUF3343 domain-containing protein [Krumholzibacteria bacterium]|nr:DUF3343 domain-containing protein [Candidatus Krumholzibacteria bacterium]